MSPLRGSALAAGALVINAFIWGVSWWPFRQLQDAGLHPLWATAGVYALVFAVLLAASFNTLGSVVASFKTHRALWLLALASGLTNVGFNWAVTIGDVVRVVLLFYLMPAWSVLVAWALLGEKPTRAALARLALAMGGVLIVLKAPDSPWPLPVGIADWLAIGGGLSFAITNALLLKCKDTPSSARMLAMFGGGAVLAAVTASAGIAYQLVPSPVLAGFAWPIFLALSVAFLISNAALQYGAARLAANTTALVMLTEIVFASSSAALLGAAEFTPRLLLGGSLIVLAALWAAQSPSVSTQTSIDAK
jgi:drug/metabolite transporter (DMT)-like permease